MGDFEGTARLLLNIVFQIMGWVLFAMGIVYLFNAWEAYDTFSQGVESNTEATFHAVMGAAHILGGIFSLLGVRILTSGTESNEHVKAIAQDVKTIKAATGRLVVQLRDKPKE